MNKQIKFLYTIFFIFLLAAFITLVLIFQQEARWHLPQKINYYH